MLKKSPLCSHDLRLQLRYAALAVVFSISLANQNLNTMRRDISSKSDSVHHLMRMSEKLQNSHLEVCFGFIPTSQIHAAARDITYKINSTLYLSPVHSHIFKILKSSKFKQELDNFNPPIQISRHTSNSIQIRKHHKVNDIFVLKCKIESSLISV